MKRFLLVPLLVLALLAALALLNARQTTKLVDVWCALLVSAQDAAKAGAWDDARQKAAEAHESWNAHTRYFHIVLQHEELNDSEELFAEAESYADAREESEFCAACAALSAQLRVLSEMQQVSIKNIL